jgi:DNA-binding transcriptional LysR family regulator
MDLEELRAFVAVSETGSFVRAAEGLGMSRSTLRRKVDALEARAGVALMESTPSGVVLTDAGRVLASQGRRMMEEMSAVLRSVRDMGDTPRGALRVTMPLGVPPHVLTRLLAGTRNAFPHLAYVIRASADPIRDELENVELALHFGDASPGPSWLSFPILSVRTRLLATASYLSRAGTPDSLEALATHELFSWQAPGETGLALPLPDGQRLVIEPRLVSADPHLLRWCAWDSLGLAHIPDAMVPDPPGVDPLVRVLPEVVGREVTLRVSVPKVLAEVPKIRLVVAGIRSFIASNAL